MDLPKVFVGCSSKGLDIANALQVNLQADAQVEIWKAGLFGLSQNTLEALFQILDSHDFAVLIFTRDDPIVPQETHIFTPRDNVVFELGLFMGRLGRERTILVTEERAQELKMPTDLDGVTVATYNYMECSGEVLAKNLETVLGPVSTRIRGRVRELGSLSKREKELGSLYRILNACIYPYPDTEIELLHYVSFRHPESFRDVGDIIEFLKDLLCDYVQPLLCQRERRALRIYFAYPLFNGVRIEGHGIKSTYCTYCVDRDKKGNPLKGQFVIGLSNPEGFGEERWREGRSISGYYKRGGAQSNCASVFKNGIAHYKHNLSSPDEQSGNYDTENELSVYTIPIEWRSHEGNARIGVLAASSKFADSIPSRLQVRLQLLGHVIGYLFSLHAVENTEEENTEEENTEDIGADPAHLAKALSLIGFDREKGNPPERFAHRVIALRQRIARYFEDSFINRKIHVLTNGELHVQLRSIVHK